MPERDRSICLGLVNEKADEGGRDTAPGVRGLRRRGEHVAPTTSSSGIVPGRSKGVGLKVTFFVFGLVGDRPALG